MEPHVPETVAARAVLWAALFLVSVFALRTPVAPNGLALVRDNASTCRLGALGSGAACPCSALPADARAALGLPQALNAVSAAELERVPGIGPVRARAIVAERERGGAFASLDALSSRVAGIGERTIDRIRPHLFAVGPDPACGAQELVELSRLGSSWGQQGGRRWKPPSRDGG